MINLDFIQGLIIGLILIIAIGPQNLFIIQQGLKKSYIFTVCFWCPPLTEQNHKNIKIQLKPFKK